MASREASAGSARLAQLHGVRWLLVGMIIASEIVAAAVLYLRTHREADAQSVVAEAAISPALPSGTVAMPRRQQEAIGLKVALATNGPTYVSASAPGRVAADQGHFAYIGPRAAGVVRSVRANIGQDVRKGDVLALIESQDVGRARLELRTQLQMLEVDRARADWLKEVYANTQELVDGLKHDADPDAIQKRLEGKVVGAGRERLMTAYAQFRLASSALERNKDLVASNVVSTSRFHEIRAAYEAASGTLQGLLDSTEYEARLAHLEAQRAVRQAETAVGVAREQLKILGVDLDVADASQEELAGAAGGSTASEPLSTYALVAPFNGTILDRAPIAPGVSVDLTTRLFTIADLSTVWLEVNVSEGDFDKLAELDGGTVRFESPAYPDRKFEAKVIYRGDLVDEASRSVKVLARASNEERLLKPGMFIEATIRGTQAETSTHVPTAAILASNDSSYVYVKTGSDRFERREVVARSLDTEQESAVEGGIAPGDEVVVDGVSKLDALANAIGERGNG